MPRDLFGYATRPFDGVGGRSRVTVPLSLAAHVLVLAAIVVVPLVATSALPALHTSLALEVVTPVVPPEPPAPRVRPAAPVTAAPANPAAAPLEAPVGVREEPEWQRAGAFEHAIDLGVVPGAIDGGVALPAPPPPPEREPQPATVRVGPRVQAPTKIHDVAPVYPAIAQSARVQGVVIVEATIGTDGTVVDARVLRSVPLLDEAALQAVRQWRYTATRLNGAPVAVVMTVTVNFQLR